MCIWYDVGIRLFYIIAMILSNYCIYHDDVKTIVLYAYCKYTTVFRTGLQCRTVCNWLVIPCINIFEKKKKKKVIPYEKIDNLQKCSEISWICAITNVFVIMVHLGYNINHSNIVVGTCYYQDKLFGVVSQHHLCEPIAKTHDNKVRHCRPSR